MQKILNILEDRYAWRAQFFVAALPAIAGEAAKVQGLLEQNQTRDEFSYQEYLLRFSTLLRQEAARSVVPVQQFRIDVMKVQAPDIANAIFNLQTTPMDVVWSRLERVLERPGYKYE